MMIEEDIRRKTAKIKSRRKTLEFGEKNCRNILDLHKKRGVQKNFICYDI